MKTGAPAGASWQDFDAYLFDIDGTLLNCSDATHYFAFCDALQFLSGKRLNLEGVQAHGNTDVGILRDALRLAGVPEASWRPKLPAAQQRMAEYVLDHEAELTVAVLPGVVALLERLAGHGAVLGVATGNLELIGRAKLACAGLGSYFRFGAFSDHFERRAQIFEEGLALARKQAGDDARVCVLGDTPEDISAARANGLGIVAVATGIYSFEELLEQRPDWCVHTFEELLETSQAGAVV